jgi:hypothetical protein
MFKKNTEFLIKVYYFLIKNKKYKMENIKMETTFKKYLKIIQESKNETINDQ